MSNKKHMARILNQLGGSDSYEAILGLSNADFQTLMLEVFRRRAQKVTPVQLFNSYRESVFVKPSPCSARKLLEIDLWITKHLGQDFELVDLSPVGPLGSCSVLATVNQNKIISSLRNTEVLADSTNSMALECALRRRELLKKKPKDETLVHLASLQRLIRNQPPKHEKHTPHFKILGLCSAGRDTGNSDFEIKSLAAHFKLYRHLFEDLQRDQDFSWAVQLTFWEDVGDSTANYILNSLREVCLGLDIELFPQRTTGISYYPQICFQIMLKVGDTKIQIVDGGFTLWTQALLNNQKERLLISGMGAELLIGVLGL